MHVSAKRASMGLASTVVAAGLIVGGVVSSSDAATTTTKTVTISGMHYLPATLKIKVGTKVKWVNHDGMLHTVTWSGKYGLPNKSVPAHATTTTITFSKVGTFKYHCAFHMMSGTIIVTKK